MLDTLVQHLLEEIAMDGQAGELLLLLDYNLFPPSPGFDSLVGLASLLLRAEQGLSHPPRPSLFSGKQ